MIQGFLDDPQSAANHMALNLDIHQRQEARGKAGKKAYNNWV